ncbi:hypothetical protein M409DRAFT_63996 [Zasmidium cellare ATCC 36951]|uniref:Decapping nuclease n=1 Tax=Zasmidium cellare ATCC 36951 TaxID=1080233 RepID=A0A6A6CXR9_ZASCE|nr:uncharacterized protein M409DRAFT_63996 [Zasmidium cellare ATCC 36951]KAF2171000.1 hypothetical protein M409DRAFT_63996 [Zasmidium cellare ATCC 36951]
MLSFRFEKLNAFQGKSAAIKRPREITVFSFDDSHKHHLDGRSLRYYYPPFVQVPYITEKNRIDLSQGFETFIKHDDSVNLHLNPLLDTIQHYEEQTGAKLKADILTWRGMMTKIFIAPFDMFGEFEMNATCYQNQLAKAAEWKSKTQRVSSSLEKMQFWGYKFETLATLPKQWQDCTRGEIEGRDTEVVNNNPQYCSVVRTGIGNHTIVIGGEVDAVEGCKPDDPNDSIPYIELKTSEDFRGDDDFAAKKFERKMCRFWAQSFLLGVPKVIIGFRSKDGHLQRLEEWKTMDIPSFVKNRGMRTWDGNVCINFAAAFLDFLKQHINDEGTWTIEQKKGDKQILLSKISDEYSRDIVSTKFREHRATFQFKATCEAKTQE